MIKYFPLDSTRATSMNSEIANTIKQYYPRGLSNFDPEYGKYPGIIKAHEIICENIGPPEQKPGPYTKKWHSLIKSLRENSEKQIKGTTYGFVPGFSADLILENYEYESFTYTKRIAFAVSMLGPFFSICGIDETFVKEKDREFGGAYNAINVVTASPYKEFEGDFDGIKLLIEKYFPNYKFVPFDVCMMHIKDVQTPHSMGQDCTIYNALFNHLFNFYTHFRSRGDGYYGSERNPNIKVTLTAPPTRD